MILKVKGKVENNRMTKLRNRNPNGPGQNDKSEKQNAYYESSYSQDENPLFNKRHMPPKEDVQMKSLS